MPEIPHDIWPESTLALLLDPYRFISKHCRHYRSDLFQTRLMLRKTICMTGPEAAELFYDESRFIRNGAAPPWLLKTLFGQGGVQALDGEAHRHRKQMFMSLMSPERIEQLGAITAEGWRNYARKWAKMDRIVLYDEVNRLLSQSVCTWVGVPLPEPEVGKRTAELMAMFDKAAGFGRGHWLARLFRKRAERWIENLIEDIRAGRIKPPEESAAWVMAMHRDLNGQLLDRHTAAVELINVLRPTVAVSVFIVFAALSLYQYPVCRERLAAGEEGFADLFVQEVRRFYPFFPAVMAVVKQDFDWKGYRFPQGSKAALDLFGTNHDERSWEFPYEFQPDRFRHWEENAFNFIPQGGGEHYHGHRCPGEWIALELIKVASNFLARDLAYDVPEQDLGIDYRRLPALPRSRFVISNVRERV